MWFLPAVLGSPETEWRKQMVFLAPARSPSYLICPANPSQLRSTDEKTEAQEEKITCPDAAISKWHWTQPRNLDPLLGAGTWPYNLLLACAVEYCVSPPSPNPNPHQDNFLVRPELLRSALTCSLKPLWEGTRRNRGSEMTHTGPGSQGMWISIVKVSVLPRLVYSVNCNQNPRSLFVEIDKLILKWI